MTEAVAVSQEAFAPLIKTIEAEIERLRLLPNSAYPVRAVTEDLATLKEAVTAAEKERTPQNVHDLSFALLAFGGGHGQRTYNLSGLREDDWNEVVLKMKALAEEAASSDDAPPIACQLAGYIAKNLWTYVGFTQDIRVDLLDVSFKARNGFSILLPSDKQAALSWYKKGSEKGCKDCAHYFRELNEHLAFWPKPAPM